MNRRCGECQLCCRLVPVKELKKGANEKCKYQKAGKGCTVYQKKNTLPWHIDGTMPMACQLWNCRWLVQEETRDLARPDRSHYVLDIFPDYVTVEDPDSGQRFNVEVVQVWCDPLYPDAHRDPALRAYLAKLGEGGVAALVRYDKGRALALLPPAMSSSGEWHEIVSNCAPGPEHTLEDIQKALSGP